LDASQNVQRLVRQIRLEELSGGLGRLVRQHLLDQAQYPREAVIPKVEAPILPPHFGYLTAPGWY
jgi:hypothetical protein